MRAYDEGDFYRVIASRVDVARFNSRWPCSELRSRAIAFTFSKANGDMVDTSIRECEDGEAAVALSQDCQTYGRAKLKLER